MSRENGKRAASGAMNFKQIQASLIDQPLLSYLSFHLKKLINVVVKGCFKGLEEVFFTSQRSRSSQTLQQLDNNTNNPFFFFFSPKIVFQEFLPPHFNWPF